MDGWDAARLKRMLASGNDVAGDFFSKHGWRSSKRGDTLKNTPPERLNNIKVIWIVKPSMFSTFLTSNFFFAQKFPFF